MLKAINMSVRAQPEG